MRRSIIVAFVLAALPAPAFATGGMLCRPVMGAGPTISLVIGHGMPPVISQANVMERGRWVSTEQAGLVIGRRSMDRQRVRVDLLDARTRRHVMSLRVNFVPRQRRSLLVATGLLVHHRRTYRVRCEES